MATVVAGPPLGAAEAGVTEPAGVESLPQRFEDNQCLECCTRLGVETTTAVVHSDPEIGIVGWLHSTICRDVWYGRNATDRASWRLVEVA